MTLQEYPATQRIRWAFCHLRSRDYRAFLFGGNCGLIQKSVPSHSARGHIPHAAKAEPLASCLPSGGGFLIAAGNPWPHGTRLVGTRGSISDAVKTTDLLWLRHTGSRNGHRGHPRTGQRPHNEIAYHALRVGDNVGEHTIVFGLLGETLEVTVKGQSRDSYAAGALTAAKYLATQAAGLYTMADALGL